MFAKLLGLKMYAYVGAAMFAAGFAYGFYVEAQRFAKFEGAVEAIGKAQEQATLVKNAANRSTQKEVTHALQTDLNRTRTDLAAAEQRLRNNAGRRIVPAPSPRPEQPVLAGEPTCPDDWVCFDAEELDAGIRSSFGTLLGELAPSVWASAAAEVAQSSWGRWARSVGSCPAL